MDLASIVSELDHHSPEFAEDPWAIYAHLRESCPVQWSDAYGGFWLLTRYDDVAEVARDDGRFSSADGVTIPPSAQTPLIPIEVDPPQFFAYRRILNPLFAPPVIARREPGAHALADGLLDKVIDAGRLDFMDDLAGPLPSILTLRLIGIPDEEWRRFADPVHQLIFRQGFADRPERQEELLAELGWMAERFVALLEERRTEPRDDIISNLVNSEIDGRSLNTDECLRMLFLIIFGGLDTTTMAIGNALAYLDRHPDRRQQLIDQPSLLPLAVEEFLRYEAPQQMLARTAREDCVIGDTKISEGDRIQLCWASANRDGEAFDRPDEVIFDRQPNRHTTFGLGAHRCLGSTLARLEFRVVLEHVLARIPRYRIEWDKAQRGDSVGTVYGYYHLPAVF